MAKTLLKEYPNQTFNKGSHDSHKNSTPMNKKIIQVSKIYKPVNAKSSNIISDVSKNKEYVKNVNIVEDRDSTKIRGVQDQNNSNMYKLNFKSKRDSQEFIKQLS